MTWAKLLFLPLILNLKFPAANCGGGENIDCSEFEDVTATEVQEAAAELRQRKLSPDGLKLFHCKTVLNPNDWRAHGMLGQALLQRPGELDNGIEALRRAYTLGPSKGKARYRLAKTLAAALRQFLQASPLISPKQEAMRRESIDVVLAMLRESSKDSESWLWLGQLLATEIPLNERGAVRSKSSVSTYTTIINKILSKRKKKKQDPAILALTAAVKISPKLALGHELLAWRFTKLGVRSKALKHAKKARKLQPKLASSHEAVAGQLSLLTLDPQSTFERMAAFTLNRDSLAPVRASFTLAHPSHTYTR